MAAQRAHLHHTAESARPSALREREGEVAAIERAVNRAAGGVGTVVSIEGPAGIGKSRLLQAAAEIAERRGSRVLSAAGRPAEQALGYGVVVQLFERPWLALDVAEQARLLDGPASPAARLISGGDTNGSEELTIIRGLLRYAGDLAVQRPGLVLLVDDGRWADAPSLRFMSYLAARVRDLPIVLVVASRPAASGPSKAALASVWAAADVMLRPAPLTAEAAARIIGDAFPADDPALGVAAVQYTGGNPLLLEALWAEAGRGGGVRSVSEIGELVPAPAVALVSDELDHLGGPARALARAMSVLDAPASLTQVAGPAGLPLEEAARAADALADVEILEPGEPLRFASALLHKAVRASIPAVQRGVAVRGETSADHAVRIEPVPPEQAIRSLVIADALEQALELLDAADLQPGRSEDPRTEAAVGTWRAWSLYHQGAVADALSVAQATADVVDESVSGLAGVIAACRLQLGELDRAAGTLLVLQAPEELAAHELPILLDVRAQVRLAQKRPGEALVDALEAGRRAQVVDAASDPGLVSWRSTAALARLALGEPGGARQLAEEELELARGGELLRVTLRCLRILGLAGAGRHRLDLLEEAVSLGADAPVRLEYLHALVDLGAAHRRSNRRSAARQPLTDALELCRERGATALARRAKAEIAAGGGRRTGTQYSGVQTLTPSERRVAALAAQGQTTRQIAGELFITVKTVEFHLRHIYRKLDISSTRAELARVLGGQGTPTARVDAPARVRNDLSIREEGNGRP